MVVCVFLFLKQKTAYEMRISDWSSDVCSSDLEPLGRAALRPAPRGGGPAIEIGGRIAVGLVLDRVFEPRVDEIGGDVGDRGILIRLGEDDRTPRLARHRHEFGHRETFMANMDRVAQRDPLVPGRQQNAERLHENGNGSWGERVCQYGETGGG